MKNSLVAALMLTVLATACKKAEEAAPKGWKVGTEFYIPVNTFSVALSTSYAIGVGDGSSAKPNTITFYFAGATRPDTGTYQVLANIAPLTPGKLTFMVDCNTPGLSSTYVSSGSDGLTARVTMENGKLNINMPEVWALPFGSGWHDSVKVSANITEMQ